MNSSLSKGQAIIINAGAVSEGSLSGLICQKIKAKINELPQDFTNDSGDLVIVLQTPGPFFDEKVHQEVIDQLQDKTILRSCELGKSKFKEIRLLLDAPECYSSLGPKHVLANTQMLDKIRREYQTNMELRRSCNESEIA